MNLFAQYYNYSDGYETSEIASTNLDTAATLAITSGMIFFILVFALIGYAVSAYLLSRIFKKAGVEGWKAWVPVYNNWVTLEIGGQQGLWAVLMFIPVINIVSVVFLFIAMYQIGLKLGKSGAFVLLAIFLPIVWLIWLAFDDSKWQGKKPVASQKPATETK